jgi:hypothetical protein
VRRRETANIDNEHVTRFTTSNVCCLDCGLSPQTCSCNLPNAVLEVSRHVAVVQSDSNLPIVSAKVQLFNMQSEVDCFSSRF